MTPLEIALYSPLVKVAGGGVGMTMMGPLSSAAEGSMRPSPPPPLKHPFSYLPDMGNHATMMQAKGYAMPGVMDYGANYMRGHSVEGFPKLLAQGVRWLLPPRSRAGQRGSSPFTGADMSNPVNRFYAAGARGAGEMLQNYYGQPTMLGQAPSLWQSLPSLLQLLG